MLEEEGGQTAFTTMIYTIKIAGGKVYEKELEIGIDFQRLNS